MISSLFLIAIQSQSSTHVTWTAPVSALGKQLAVVSRLTGTSLRCEPALEAEPVFVMVKDLPLERFQSALAYALHAEWRQTRQGWELVRSASTMAQHRATLIKARIELLRKGIAEELKRADQVNTNDSEMRQAVKQMLERARAGGEMFYDRGAQMLDPATRLLPRLIRHLDLDEIANMPRGARWVFSSNATAMQRQLPDAALEEVQRYLQEAAALERVAMEFESQAAGDINTIHANSVIRSYSGKTATRLLLSLRSEGSFGEPPQVSAQLRMFDAQGDLVGRALGAPIAWAIGPPGPFEPVKFETSTEVMFRGLGEFERKVLKGRKNSPPPTPEIRRMLLNPEEFDPNSGLVSNCLQSIAEAQGKNFIAAVPDQLHELRFRFRRNAKVDVNEALNTILSYPIEQQVQRDVWILRPKNVAQTTETRADRKLLGACLRAFESGKGALLPTARMALLSPQSEDLLDVQWLFLTPVTPNIPNRGTLSFMDEPILRWFGSMSSDQLEELSAGKALDSANMSAEQRWLIAQAIYATNDLEGAAQTGYSVGQGAEKLQSESTQAFPTGLPGFTVSMKVTDSYRAFLPKTSRFAGMMQDPHSITAGMLTRERPDLQDRYGILEPYPQELCIQYGQTLEFNFDISGYKWRQTLEDFPHTLPPPSKYEAWPEPLRKEIERLSDIYKKQWGIGSP